MLDKLKLNNSITLLKSDVLKAKGQIIQNLIRRIRIIQKDSKSKQDSSKKESKVAKLTDEITFLKKLPFRQIVMNALLLQKDPKVILSDGKATTEERCTARTCDHKILFKKLVALKDVFNLQQEENMKGLRSMGYSKTKKAKLKKKMQNVKKTKMEWVEEDIVDKEIEKPEASHVEDDKVSVDGSDPKPKKVRATAGPKVKATKVKKIEMSSKEEDTLEVERTADSFFMTASGENYKATVGKSIPDEDHQWKRPYKEDDDYEVESRINQHQEQENYDSGRQLNNERNYPDRRTFNQNQSNNYYEKERYGNSQSSWRGKQERVGESNQDRNFKFSNKFDATPLSVKPSVTPNDTTKDLHPSWAAKLNKKPMITAFVGKKITFDD